MTDTAKWRTEGVRVVRGATLAHAISGGGRATVFDFAGASGSETWIGAVAVPPGGKTGAHHHGNTEVALYVVSGRAQLRWGERLEFMANLGPGDFAHFAPFVPHQEVNPEAAQTLEFVVVRSNREGIAVAIQTMPAEAPEDVY